MSEQGGLTGCATPQHGEKNKREAVRKEKGIKMTAKELNLAARTVFAEAATEGLNGQMAVAQTMYDQLYHNIIGADGSGFGFKMPTRLRLSRIFVGAAALRL